jgi:RNA polymerase sigma-70 factor (ECF subfamily)
MTFSANLYSSQVTLPAKRNKSLATSSGSRLKTHPLQKDSGLTKKPAEKFRVVANLDDNEYISRVLAGELAAFETLVERYNSPVYNFCCRMLNNRTDGEDASQEVFLRAFTQLASYRPTYASFITWLLSIAAHYCIDLLRRQRPQIDLELVSPWKSSSEPQPEEILISQERNAQVQALLNKVPHAYRSVLILRYWNDLSYEELASATGLSLNAVKTRLFRGRHILADELAKQDSQSG